jgi:hypothetical protein
MNAFAPPKDIATISGRNLIKHLLPRQQTPRRTTLFDSNELERVLQLQLVTVNSVFDLDVYWTRRSSAHHE